MATVGSIVYATKSGLGILAKLLYEAKIIDKVLVVQHPKFDSHIEWYESEDTFWGRSGDTTGGDEFLKSIDTLFLLEAPLPDPFDWALVQKAKYLGKKVVLMPMYESTPRQHLSVAVDQIICPSELDLEYFRDFDSTFIPVPSPNDVEWNLRETANVFVHNVGHGGIFSRNGTVELIEALPLIKSDIKLIIRIQPDAGPELLDLVDKVDDPRVEVVTKQIPFSELWSTGDVFLFPEKFNGLSLPLQEAYTAGMCVMAGDRFPINRWLPQEPLIPVKGHFYTELPWIGIKVKNAIMEPQDIASTIDNWAGKDITKLSLRGKEWAKTNNGESLKPQYDRILR